MSSFQTVPDGVHVKVLRPDALPHVEGFMTATADVREVNPGKVVHVSLSNASVLLQMVTGEVLDCDFSQSPDGQAAADSFIRDLTARRMA